MTDSQRASQDIQLGIQKVRHKISTALAFIESSLGNLAGDHRDVAKATRLYEVGCHKLREALAELDSMSNGSSDHETE